VFVPCSDGAVKNLLTHSLTVIVRLRISPPTIKLTASNFARWFIGVLGRESPIFVNFASPEAPKSDESASAPLL